MLMSSQTQLVVWSPQRFDSATTGKEDTQLYTQPEEISDENADCKRGTHVLSPASVAPSERHTQEH